MTEIEVSTPSRICLFGEHQDYLGLEVIASAINLRFKATINNRKDNLICLNLNGENIHRELEIDISKPIEYENKRDYCRSVINVLIREGYPIKHGFDIYMISDIPIGKGMCSSSTMIIVLIKALLEGIGHADKDDAEKIAYLGFKAEVLEFNEPGGMMDHYTSAIGGLVHLNFQDGKTQVERIDKIIPGNFILFDSLQDKDTTTVLANAKTPVLEALEDLKCYGINSIKDFVFQDENLQYLEKLSPIKKKKISAAIENYRILLRGKYLLENGNFNGVEFGKLLKEHHKNLRDGLGISTDIIEDILNTAYENGALGGKINGSGGGGCCFVYAEEKDTEKIVNAVRKKGYPCWILKSDVGVKVN